MPVPNGYDDGLFSIAAQNGCDEYRLPFFDRGDGRSVEIHRVRRVASASYVRPTLMQKQRIARFNADIYLVSVTDAVSVGNGLVEWREIWVSVPKTRYETTSIVYQFQLLRVFTGLNPDPPQVIEYGIPMNARVRYEYSIEQMESLIAPRIEIIADRVINFGGWRQFNEDEEVLAENSTVSLYMGNIYERRSILIKYPSYQTF